jgi:uroporphyrinogen-III decarboxylase
LGSQGILHFGTPAEIRAEIFRLHELFRADGGYVLSPAKPLADGMPLENAVAVVEAFSELAAR